jgi:hypothetical protein
MNTWPSVCQYFCSCTMWTGAHCEPVHTHQRTVCACTKLKASFTWIRKFIYGVCQKWVISYLTRCLISYLTRCLILVPKKISHIIPNKMSHHDLQLTQRPIIQGLYFICHLLFVILRRWCARTWALGWEGHVYATIVPIRSEAVTVSREMKQGPCMRKIWRNAFTKYVVMRTYACYPAVTSRVWLYQKCFCWTAVYST